MHSSKARPKRCKERNLRTAELERIGDDLRLIARDLQNEQNLLQVMQRNLSSIPLDKRYSASQSLDQRQKNLQRVKKEAEQLAEAVRDLMKKNGFLSPIQAAMKVQELLENLERTADQDQAIHQITAELGTPSITPAHVDQPAMSMLIPTIVFAIYGIRRIVGKVRASRAQAD